MAKHSSKRSFGMVMLCLVLWPFTMMAQDEGAPEPREKSASSVQEAHARIMFRQGDFAAALLLLGEKSDSLAAMWLKAESLFRLRRYREAKGEYRNLLPHERSASERRKAAIRIFDCELLGGELEAAIKSFDEYEKRYKNTSSLMKYSLGKTLYDAHRYEQASKILSAIPEANGYTMRARFLVAALGLDSRKDAESVKLFAAIEAMKMLSVEDYGVHQLAILAQARLLAAQNQYTLAQKTYERVSLKGIFGKVATTELLRMMVMRAEMASLGEGPFSKAPLFRRQEIAQDALEVANNALMRFRKVHEVGFKDPELLTLMASLLVKARRYDDARIAYGELIDHYRPIEHALRFLGQEEKLWPFFVLNFDQKPGFIDDTPLVKGVPQSFMKQLPQVAHLTALKQQILAEGQKLRELQDGARLAKHKGSALIKAQKNHQAIVHAYERLVVAEQETLAIKAADLINKFLAEAEFKRAELPLLHMRDMKKKSDVVREFQSKAIEQFEHEVEKVTKDGSS